MDTNRQFTSMLLLNSTVLSEFEWITEGGCNKWSMNWSEYEQRAELRSNLLFVNPALSQSQIKIEACTNMFFALLNKDFCLSGIVSAMTKTSGARHGEGSSHPGTSTASAWCLGRQKRSQQVSASRRRLATPEDCPLRVRACITRSFYLAFKCREKPALMCTSVSELSGWEREALLSVRALTVSLVPSGGCSAVLYEVLDDSPDDMYLDWFQGQLYFSEGSWAWWPSVHWT